MSWPGLKPAASIALTAIVERRLGRGQVGREAAFVADVGVEPGLLELALERLEHFRTPAHRLAQARRAERHDHEFLEVDRIVGVHAAVDDVHHRRRQDARRRSADIAIELQVGGFRRRLGDRQRNAEDRVGAKPRLVGRAVEGDHRLVDLDLLLSLETADGVENVAGDRLDRLLDALAAVAALVAVAQLDRLMRAGRGARRHGGAAHGAVLEHDVDLDSRVAATVQDLARDNVYDGGHAAPPDDRLRAAPAGAIPRALLRQARDGRKS